MKKINFIKMAGAGNDFIMIDAKKGLNYKKLARTMCDRTNGIGADGLIVLEKPKKNGFDYKMRIINADGSEAEMCGNGVRCLSSYIVKEKKPKKKQFAIETIAGEILGQAKGEVANVRLSDPADYQEQVPIKVGNMEIHVSSIDTGVPHTVVFVDGLEGINVEKIGGIIRYHSRFKPRGTNVNFAEQVNANLVNARTYERGVEGETKACGTGSVAVAIVTYLRAHPQVKDQKGAKMSVRTASGEVLEVTFDIKDRQVSNVWLKGSAKFIAKGEYYV